MRNSRKMRISNKRAEFKTVYVVEEVQERHDGVFLKISSVCPAPTALDENEVKSISDILNEMDKELTQSSDSAQTCNTLFMYIDKINMSLDEWRRQLSESSSESYWYMLPNKAKNRYYKGKVLERLPDSAIIKNGLQFPEPENNADYSHINSDELIKYGNLVEMAVHTALRSKGNAQWTYGFDDMMAEGFLGLLDALEKYDVSKGESFEGYASYRILGAIRDGGRGLDPYKRKHQEKRIAFDKAYRMLLKESEDIPLRREVYKELGWTARSINFFESLEAVNFLSLEEMLQGKDDAPRYESENIALYPLNGAGSEGIAEQVAKEEQNTALLQALSKLPEKQRRVVILYYYCKLPISNIGKFMGYSEVWTHSYHRTALANLRDAMEMFREL